MLPETEHPKMLPVSGEGGASLVADGGDPSRLHLRASLPAIRFVEFSPEVCALYEQCREITHGGFQLVAFWTNTIRCKTGLPGLLPATKAPAQALGWIAAVVPFRLFNPIRGPEAPFPMAEPLAVKRYEWVTVVDRERAEESLVPVLRHALAQLKLVVLRATANGATI